MTTTDGSWEQRYDKLVADLHTLAERQRWCEEFETFKRANNVPSPKKPEPVKPERPVGMDYPVLKFDGWLPIAYPGLVPDEDKRAWYFTNSPDTKYTWADLVSQHGLEGQEYEVLAGVQYR